jgi:hypothetical protein
MAKIPTAQSSNQLSKVVGQATKDYNLQTTKRSPGLQTSQMDVSHLYDPTGDLALAKSYKQIGNVVATIGLDIQEKKDKTELARYKNEIDEFFGGVEAKAKNNPQTEQYNLNKQLQKDFKEGYLSKNVPRRLKDQVYSYFDAGSTKNDISSMNHQYKALIAESDQEIKRSADIGLKKIILENPTNVGDLMVSLKEYDNNLQGSINGNPFTGNKAVQLEYEKYRMRNMDAVLTHFAETNPDLALEAIKQKEVTDKLTAEGLSSIIQKANTSKSSRVSKEIRDTKDSIRATVNAYNDENIEELPPAVREIISGEEAFKYFNKNEVNTLRTALKSADKKSVFKDFTKEGKTDSEIFQQFGTDRSATKEWIKEGRRLKKEKIDKDPFDYYSNNILMQELATKRDQAIAAGDNELAFEYEKEAINEYEKMYYDDHGHYPQSYLSLDQQSTYINKYLGLENANAYSEDGKKKVLDKVSFFQALEAKYGEKRMSAVVSQLANDERSKGIYSEFYIADSFYDPSSPNKFHSAMVNINNWRGSDDYVASKKAIIRSLPEAVYRHINYSNMGSKEEIAKELNAVADTALAGIPFNYEYKDRKKFSSDDIEESLKNSNYIYFDEGDLNQPLPLKLPKMINGQPLKKSKLKDKIKEVKAQVKWDDLSPETKKRFENIIPTADNRFFSTRLGFLAKEKKQDKFDRLIKHNLQITLQPDGNFIGFYVNGKYDRFPMVNKDGSYPKVNYNIDKDD